MTGPYALNTEHRELPKFYDPKTKPYTLTMLQPRDEAMYEYQSFVDQCQQKDCEISYPVLFFFQGSTTTQILCKQNKEDTGPQNFKYVAFEHQRNGNQVNTKIDHLLEGIELVNTLCFGNSSGSVLGEMRGSEERLDMFVNYGASEFTQDKKEQDFWESSTYKSSLRDDALKKQFKYLQLPPVWKLIHKFPIANIIYGGADWVSQYKKREPEKQIYEISGKMIKLSDKNKINYDNLDDLKTKLDEIFASRHACTSIHARMAR